MRPLEHRFVATLDELGAAQPGRAVVVALSGGADSVALLRLLGAVREARGFTLRAAHLHHGLRGAAADADQAFVTALCAQLGVPLTCEQVDVPALAKQAGQGFEQAAREARYAFFERVAGPLAAEVALGHHVEDQAETVLLHAVRGSGLKGLCGMQARQGRFIRPLLGFHRAELQAYLNEIGQPWREDATNADLAYARNFMRHQVLPELARLNPNVVEALAGLAERLGLDEQYLWQQTTRLATGLHKTPYGGFLPTVALETADPALQHRVMYETLAGCGIRQIEARHIRALVDLLALPPGASGNLPQDWRALRGQEHLHLLSPTPEPTPPPQPLALAGATNLDRGVGVTARPAKPGELGDGVWTQALDAAALPRAVLRYRQPGDVFQPLGAAGSQPFKQTLSDAHIDRPFREMLPVIALGKRILWAIGLRPAADAAITPLTTEAVLLTFQGELPWTKTKARYRSI